MHPYWNCSYLGQLEVYPSYRIFFELGKQQRLKLPVLLESREAKSPLSEIFPSPMHLLNSLLENLRRNFTKSWKFFLGFGQVIKLIDFVGELQISRENVFLFKRASIKQTLPAIAPIFNLSQCVIVGTSTDFHPLNQCLLLSGIWIYVAIVKGQHSIIIKCLLAKTSSIKVNFRDIESYKINLGESIYLPPNQRLWRKSYSSPKPPS